MYVCVRGCANIYIYIWRTEFKARCLLLLLTSLLFGGRVSHSLEHAGCSHHQPQHWDYWPALLFSALHMDTEAQTQALKPAQQALYPLSRLPSHKGVVNSSGLNTVANNSIQSHTPHDWPETKPALRTIMGLENIYDVLSRVKYPCHTACV